MQSFAIVWGGVGENLDAAFHSDHDNRCALIDDASEFGRAKNAFL